MAGFTTKAPRVGGPRVSMPRSAAGESVRFQKSVRPPTKFPHVSVSRRDYSKREQGAENSVPEGDLNIGDTGLTGES